MADKKHRARKGLDAAGTLATAAGALVDLGATGGAIAGGKLLWDAVTAGIGRRRRRQAEAYLKRLAEALGEEHTAALAVELDQAGENEVWETVEEGFRQMMGAINETAKRCVALLVADYVVRQELPDRDFQLIGELLSRCDDELIRTIGMLCRQMADVYVTSVPDEFPVDESTYALCLEKDPELPTPRVARPQFGAPVFASGKHLGGEAKLIKRDSDGFPCPKNIEAALYLLERSDFGELPTHQIRRSPKGNVTSKHPNGASGLLYILEPQADRFIRLSAILEPILLQPHS